MGYFLLLATHAARIYFTSVLQLCILWDLDFFLDLDFEVFLLAFALNHWGSFVLKT